MTDEELNARFSEMSSAMTQLAHVQIQFAKGQAELRQVVMETRADLARLAEKSDREQVELRQGQAELRQVVMETRADLAQITSTLSQDQAELRRLVMQTREDMAQFTAWAGAMTQAVEELRTTAMELRATVMELRAIVAELRAEQTRINQRQAESDQRFEVLLEEIRFLIRRQQPPQENEADSG